MIARHARDFTWNRGCSSNSPPLTHGDQIPHPLEDSDNQIPSSPGIARGEDVEASIWPIHYGYIMYGNMICQHALLGKQLRFNHRISFKTHHEKSAVIMMGLVIGVFLVYYGIYLRCSTIRHKCIIRSTTQNSCIAFKLGHYPIFLCFFKKRHKERV